MAGEPCSHLRILGIEVIVVALCIEAERLYDFHKQVLVTRNECPESLTRNLLKVPVVFVSTSVAAAVDASWPDTRRVRVESSTSSSEIRPKLIELAFVVPFRAGLNGHQMGNAAFLELKIYPRNPRFPTFEGVLRRKNGHLL